MLDLQSEEGLRASEVLVSLGASLTSARSLQHLLDAEEASVLRLYTVKTAVSLETSHLSSPHWLHTSPCRGPSCPAAQMQVSASSLRSETHRCWVPVRATRDLPYRVLSVGPTSSTARAVDTGVGRAEVQVSRACCTPAFVLVGQRSPGSALQVCRRTKALRSLACSLSVF